MRIKRADIKLGVTVGLAVAAITLLRYLVVGSLGSHAVYRSLYYVPILLAAVGFGKRGGFLAAAAITPVYAPQILMELHALRPLVGNLLEVVSFYIFGIAVGTYADLRRSYQRKTVGDSWDVPTASIGDKILVCVDESAPGQQAAICAAELFGREPGISIVLLSAAAEPNPDFFPSPSELSQEISRVNAAATQAILRATATLKKYGVPESRIRTRIVSGRGGRMSDRVLREQREGNYRLIIAGKHQLTRAQEFLFGSLAVRLAREATCSVLVVGGQESQSAQAKTASPAK